MRSRRPRRTTPGGPSSPSSWAWSASTTPRSAAPASWPAGGPILSWALTRQVLAQVRPLLVVLATGPLMEPLPDDHRVLRRDPATEHLQLEPLRPLDILTLVCDRLGVRRLPEPVAGLIEERAQGNPFLSEELADALRDTGLIRITGDPAAGGARLTDRRAHHLRRAGARPLAPPRGGARPAGSATSGQPDRAVPPHRRLHRGGIRRCHRGLPGPLDGRGPDGVAAGPRGPGPPSDDSRGPSGRPGHAPGSTRAWQPTTSAGRGRL